MSSARTAQQHPPPQQHRPPKRQRSTNTAHSTASLRNKLSATTLSRASVRDSVAFEDSTPTTTTTLAPSSAKVDFHQRTAASSASSVNKLRTHSRLPSFGGILRSRAPPAGTQQPHPRQQVTGGGDLVLPHQHTAEDDLQPRQAQHQHHRQQTQPPVSPSNASSPLCSDSSTLSNKSSETTLSDDAKSIGGRSTSSKDYFHGSSTTEGELAHEYDVLERRHSRLAPLAKPPTMHQTSSRLLRMTEDDRPFTRDFKDLFSTLMVSLPLTSHRVRFTRIEHTFTTEEAITNLGNLRFSQSNRMPDPKEPSRIVTTTTTTTFSMAKEMARSVCMRFLEARFVESVEGRTDFSSRSSVWQLTPKGMHILFRFCQRNGIHQRHVNELLDSPRNMMQLVILEREPDTDKINRDQATVNVLFRRFAGDTGPNVKSNSTASDTESVSDYATGLVGVRMQRSRRADRDTPYTFTGKAAFDWLMDCCTTVDKREVFEIANLFMQHGLIEPASDEKYAGSGSNARFAASKHITYAVTQKGLRVAGWVTSPNGSVNGEATTGQRAPAGVARDSNTNRMTIIIRDPALRLLFREYLRETHCEENLAFYVEVDSFLSDYDRAKRSVSPPKMDVIRETLASAYSLYNAFLAPGSPCELNIDHNLRNALASRMTRAVGEDEQMIRSLDEVAGLFDQAQSSVFKLMASDSVPKFSREPKYATMLKERNLESMLANVSIS